MKIISKSIARKTFFALILFLGIIFGFYYVLKKYFSVTMDDNFLLYSLLGFLILFFAFVFLSIALPLKKIIIPIQDLLTGRPYKRIYTTRVDEIGVLAYFFNKMTSSIGEVSGSIKDRARMLGELNTASKIQQDILPKNIPEVPGLFVVAKNKPATELGGDAFDVFQVENNLYLYVGDVTGHGIAAGLLMTMVSTLINVFANVFHDPLQIMVNVNKYVKRHVKLSMFMTMVLLTWDIKNKKMTYVGAGHEHILIYRAVSGEVESIVSGGVALGMVPNNEKIIKEKELLLSPGDYVVLYSDGITEARNESEELFGLERLKQLVKEYCPQYSPTGVHYHIAKSVSDYMGSHVQDDDMTLIVIKREEEKSEEITSEVVNTSW